MNSYLPTLASDPDTHTELFGCVQHVAIIMDGNRRWARKNGFPIKLGHLKGVEVVEEIVKAAVSCGVKVLTLYSFSTENWKRSSEQVAELLELLTHYIAFKTADMIHNGIRLNVIGNLESLPQKLQEVIARSQKETEACSTVDLVLAINYGGRDEICRAMKAIAKECLSGKLAVEDINETLISRNLDTARWRDPELLIRTSGERRISNFLLWQSSYSEIFISEVLWPDFQRSDFFDAINNYQKRHRRMGGG